MAGRGCTRHAEPLVGVVVLTREESAPVAGSAHDKGPTDAWRIRGVVATSLTRECDGFRREKVGHNVARLIDAPVADEHEIEPFTREEAHRILGAAMGHRNAARWSVALVLGIRQGEALGLRWSIEQGVRVVQEILGHTRHHDGAIHPRRLPQVRDASALIGSALWGTE
jgi:integrase